MPIVKGPERTFDTVAAEYAKLRPGYPDALYTVIFDYIIVRFTEKPASGKEIWRRTGEGTGSDRENIRFC